MTHGAHTPLTRARPDQPANLTDHTAGPDPAPAKPCQPLLTPQHTNPLEQAGPHQGELIRLASQEVLVAATGQPLEAGVFRTHLRERYLERKAAC